MYYIFENDRKVVYEGFEFSTKRGRFRFRHKYIPVAAVVKWWSNGTKRNDCRNNPAGRPSPENKNKLKNLFSAITRLVDLVGRNGR